MKLLALAALAALTLSAAEPVSRTVTCHDSDVIPVNMSTAYSTLFEFAPGQDIADIIFPNTEHWDAHKQANIVVLKTDAKGARTDLHVITSGGTICTFVIHEIADDKATPVDLRLFVKTPNDNKAVVTPAYYSFDQVAAMMKQLVQTSVEANSKLATIEKNTVVEKAAVQEQTAASVEHKYTWDQNERAKKSFGVTAIYNVDGFTVIEANPLEAPAIYEIRDGKPSLIEATYKDGKYTVPKIVDDGYLRVGKSKLTFHRVDS